MEVREAEDPATAHACASFQEIHAATALIAVRREIGVAEKAESGHQRGRRVVGARRVRCVMGRM
jgi:hypothetical protein